MEPRIGVFVCHCGINIGGVVNVPEVKEYARTLPNVVYVDENLYTCSQDSINKIKEAIVQEKLNRVVVASCTPRTHEPLFQEGLKEIGLNPYLFEMVNIREQNTWVHMKEPGEALRKAKDLIRMAVARAARLEELTPKVVPVKKKVLIIGAGIAGISAALDRQATTLVRLQNIRPFTTWAQYCLKDLGQAKVFVGNQEFDRALRLINRVREAIKLRILGFEIEELIAQLSLDILLDKADHRVYCRIIRELIGNANGIDETGFTQRVCHKTVLPELTEARAAASDNELECAKNALKRAVAAI